MSNKSKWAEIRTDFFDEEERCVYVDGWKTDHGDEEGQVIAKVNVDTKEVEYLIENGKKDPYVQEEIEFVINDIENGDYEIDNANEVDELIENATKKVHEHSDKNLEQFKKSQNGVERE